MTCQSMTLAWGQMLSLDPGGPAFVMEGADTLVTGFGNFDMMTVPPGDSIYSDGTTFLKFCDDGTGVKVSNDPLIPDETFTWVKVG